MILFLVLLSVSSFACAMDLPEIDTPNSFRQAADSTRIAYENADPHDYGYLGKAHLEERAFFARQMDDYAERLFAGTKKQNQRKFDLLLADLCIQMELIDFQSRDRNVLTFYKNSRRDVLWRTLKSLEQDKKNDFLKEVIDITVKKMYMFDIMRLYLAGCAGAGCTMNPESPSNARIIQEIVQKNDVELLSLLNFEVED